MSLLRSIGVGAIVLMASGCYRYVPVQASPEPGRVVRANVTQAGAEALAPRLGPGVLELDGLLLGQEDQELAILVETYMTRQQGALSGNNEAIRLPWAQIAGVSEKRLDLARSTLFGAALVGGVVAAIAVFGQDERVLEPDDPEDPGSPQRRGLPLDLGPLRLRLFGRSP